MNQEPQPSEEPKQSHRYEEMQNIKTTSEILSHEAGYVQHTSPLLSKNTSLSEEHHPKGHPPHKQGLCLAAF